MRRRRALVLLGTLAACVAACAREQAKSQPDTTRATIAPMAMLDSEPLPALFGCLIGDSAVYADVRTDPETGDTVGVWITFFRVGESIDGVTVLNQAGQSDTIPFARVQLSSEDSIALDMPHAADLDTSRFLGRVDCNRLWGRQRNRRESPSRPALYRRVYGLDLPPA